MQQPIPFEGLHLPHLASNIHHLARLALLSRLYLFRDMILVVYKITHPIASGVQPPDPHNLYSD